MERWTQGTDSERPAPSLAWVTLRVLPWTCSASLQTHTIPGYIHSLKFLCALMARITDGVDKLKCHYFDIKKMHMLKRGRLSEKKKERCRITVETSGFLSLRIPLKKILLNNDKLLHCWKITSLGKLPQCVKSLPKQKILASFCPCLYCLVYAWLIEPQSWFWVNIFTCTLLHDNSGFASSV